jgi:hypothetical protein
MPLQKTRFVFGRLFKVQTYEDLLNRSGIKQLPLYLFTDDAVEFYEKLGFKPQAIGLGKVVGQWLGGDA